MKQSITITITLLLLVVLTPATAQTVHVYRDENGDDWHYTSENNVTTLIKYYTSRADVDVTTPTQIDGHILTAIGNGAFKDKNSLKNLTISEGVESIGDNACTNCINLASVNLPSSVRSIGNEAFNLCKSLTSIEIPDGVEEIADGTFSGCASLASVTIPGSVKTIGKMAFLGCTALKSITIPNSVTSIGENAFYHRDKADHCAPDNVYFAGTFGEWKSVTRGSQAFGNYDYYKIEIFHWLCTVTFDVQGHGTAPAPLVLYSNIGTLTEPEAPVAKGYEFGGWYTFADCRDGSKVDFGYGVTYDRTLYAKWTPLENTITFNLGGKGTPIPSQTVASGNLVAEPPVQFDGDEGIEGWYTDADKTQPYDFTTPADETMTLYAKWAAAGTATIATTGDGTAVLTDTKGRPYTEGKIMPGVYTLTVTPAEGKTFTGLYKRLARDGGTSPMPENIAGSSQKTFTLDLTDYDAEISVNFTDSPIVTVTTTTDGISTAGSWTLTDGHSRTYTDGSPVYPVGDITTEADKMTLEVTPGTDAKWAMIIVNNGKKQQVDPDSHSYTFTPNGSIDIELFFYHKDLGMIEIADNSNADVTDKIVVNEGQRRMVKLTGRTLFRDGSWNTIYLPFDLDIEGSALDKKGVTLMELDTENSYFGNGTLHLNFIDAGKTIKASKPYIIKWTSSSYNITSPAFVGVTIKGFEGTPSSRDEAVWFVGHYSAETYNNEKDILYLGADNTLYYPDGVVTIGPCRAHFELQNGLTVGTADGNVRTFSLNFGDADETDIRDLHNASDASTHPSTPSAWYTLDGRRLSTQPAAKGLYIHQGRKVAVK